MKIKIRSYWPAIGWFALSTLAFFLPGKVLPKNIWFGIPHFDKLVHVGLFAVMVILWCLPLIHRPIQNPLIRMFVIISFGFFGYGVLIECIQHFYVSNRSFAWGDIGADAAGCFIGFVFSWQQWKATLN